MAIAAMGWWRFTRMALEALTAPKADTASCDRAMEQLARDSRLGGALHRGSWMVRAAWMHSRTRALLVPRLGELAPIRVRGWMLIVAGATVLGLNALKPTPVGPLSSLVPSLVIVAGVLVMLMARPLARAILHRTS
jgi:hypothetical protein